MAKDFIVPFCDDVNIREITTNKGDKIRLLPYPDNDYIIIDTFVFEINTEGLNIGDYVKIKEEYSRLYDTSITYKITNFSLPISNSVCAILNDKILKFDGELTEDREINITFLEIDNIHYRKQKLKKLLNNK